MIIEQAFVGTELKFIVDIAASGFSMVDDDFTVTLRRGSTQHIFEKNELVRDEDDNFYVCFDSAEFGKGVIDAIITAYVPDTDFDDGFRTEVYKFKLINILGL